MSTEHERVHWILHAKRSGHSDLRALILTLLADRPRTKRDLRSIVRALFPHAARGIDYRGVGDAVDVLVAMRQVGILVRGREAINFGLSRQKECLYALIDRGREVQRDTCPLFSEHVSQPAGHQ